MSMKIKLNRDVRLEYNVNKRQIAYWVLLRYIVYHCLERTNRRSATKLDILTHEIRIHANKRYAGGRPFKKFLLNGNRVANNLTNNLGKWRVMEITE